MNSFIKSYIFLSISLLALGCGYTGGDSRSTPTEASTSKTDQESDAEDLMVLVEFVNTGVTISKKYYIDSFEASIPDSTNKAKSVVDAVPKYQINYKQAKTACLAAGKRLCTYDEWQNACRGKEDLQFAVQNTSTGMDRICYAGQTQYASDTSSTPVRTGSMVNCKTKSLELYDMIGNVSEWTDKDGTPVAAGPMFYGTIEQSSCTQTTIDPGTSGIDAGTKSNDIGFRCCKDAPSDAQ